MLRDKLILVIYLISFVCCGVSFYYVNYYCIGGISNSTDIAYGSNVLGIAVYEPSEFPNSMKCNLTTVNKIISEMIAEGYFYVYQDLSKGSILDVCLHKDGEFYRILYNRDTMDYLCISKPYSKNYYPMTYINK